MFENLTSSFARTIGGLRGRRLTENNVQDALRDVRNALLEADVALTVAVDFIDDVKERSLGKTVTTSVQPGEEFVGHVNDALVELLGKSNDGLDLQVGRPPAVVLMAGVQGVGKTTTAAKLGKYLSERESKKVAVVSADVYRPAAIEQLRTLADQASLRFVESKRANTPLKIAKRALKDARRNMDDVLIVDTAGRQAVDDEMMSEISGLHDVLNPKETLFVVDALMGQDAATTAEMFNKTLPLTGVVLAKADGDARGGAALTVRAITHKPIKFLGVGEGLDGLEAFHPDRIASRILGMGDVLTLLEDAQRKVNKKKSERLALKLARGRGFNLQDMRDQYAELENMGGLSALTSRMPSTLADMGMRMRDVDESELQRQVVIIDSMTPQERHFPNLLDSSRKQRIAQGSGTEVRDVNILLRNFSKMQKQMRRIGGKSGQAMLRNSEFAPQSAAQSKRRRRKR